jgi:hypothetical protein
VENEREESDMSRKTKDIIGQYFYSKDGEWWIKAIKEANPAYDKNGNRIRRITCECKCGKHFDVRMSNLYNGATTSCGCYRGYYKRAPKAEKAQRNTNCITKNNLIGMTFGHLTVLEYVQQQTIYGVRTYCLCQCDCGNTKLVLPSQLIKGDAKSCGCIYKKMTENGALINFVDATMTAEQKAERAKKSGETRRKIAAQKRVGRIFGTLKVLKDTGYNDKYRAILWECECVNCGNQVIASTRQLCEGKSPCGCTTSKGEAKIQNALNEIHIQFSKQQKFNTCLNPQTGANLRFDFNVVDSLLIEFDGPQHDECDDRGWNTPESHANLVYRDNIKNSWCRENNKQLIRIPYTELSRIDAAYMLTLMRLAAMEEDEELVCPV